MLVCRFAARGAGWLALAALVALLAAGVLRPAGPAEAAPPDDLELILSLANDADNVVPPDSRITLAASLRHTGIEHNLEITEGTLRTSGHFDFEATSRSKVDIAAQKIGAAAWRGSNAMFGDQYGGGALSENTLVVNAIKSVYHDHDNDPSTIDIWQQAGGKFYVYNAETKTEIAQIDPPAGANSDYFANTVLVHQASGANTATVFVTSPRDTVGGVAQVGRLYIYTVNYGVTPPTVTLAQTVEPSAADATYNRRPSTGDSFYTASDTRPANFGTTAALSGDGSILVVGAPLLHRLGGAVVFHRPATGWGALTWADGAQLSPMKVAAEGAWYGGTGGYTNEEKNKAETIGWTETGGRVGISRDGSTIAFGGFNRTNQRTGGTTSRLCSRDTTLNRDSNACGWIAVFEKPSGNWATDDSPDAELYHDGAVHVQRLGQWLALNHDGSVIAGVASQRQPARSSPGYVYIYNEPAGTWNGAITSAHATLSVDGGKLGDVFGQGGVSFNVDGSKLAISNSGYQDATGAGLAKGAPNTSSFYGRAWIFDKPSGAWADATSANATLVEAPSRRVSAFFGGVRYAADGERLLVGQSERSSYYVREIGPGAMWLFDSSLDPVFFAGSSCAIEGGEILDDSSDDINTCELTLPAMTEIVIPAGAAAGDFTVSGSVTIDGQTYHGSLAVRVGTIKEVADATLDFAIDDRGSVGVRDDRPWPSAIAPGGRTVLRLSLLSETGKAPAAGSVGSILMTTTAGRLSTNINDMEGAVTTQPAGRLNQDGCRGTGGFACQVPVERTVLTSANADKILVTLSAPSNARPGTATVIARVTSLTGDTFSDTVTVAITGAFKTLEIEEPSTSVLNVDTPDSGADKDDRDIALLSVTAQDTAGNSVMVPGTEPATVDSPRTIPTHRLTIKAPDGKSNPAGISARWLPNAAGTGLELDADDNPQIEIDVDASAEAALPSGEYTIEARVNRQTWSQTFRVAGGPETIVIEAPAEDALVGSRITVSATVTDAAGRPVSDGTEVTFTERGIGSAVLILTSSSKQRTVDGQASAELLAVSAGVAYVTVSTGEIADARVIRARADGGAMPLASERLSSTRTNDFAVWLASTRTQASLLLPELEGVLSILRWSGGRWLRYAVIGGRLVPGSTDFTIPRGAVLWLANGN